MPPNTFVPWSELVVRYDIIDEMKKHGMVWGPEQLKLRTSSFVREFVTFLKIRDGTFTLPPRTRSQQQHSNGAAAAAAVDDDDDDDDGESEEKQIAAVVIAGSEEAVYHDSRMELQRTAEMLVDYTEEYIKTNPLDEEANAEWAEHATNIVCDSGMDAVRSAFKDGVAYGVCAGRRYVPANKRRRLSNNRSSPPPPPPHNE